MAEDKRANQKKKSLELCRSDRMASSIALIRLEDPGMRRTLDEETRTIGRTIWLELLVEFLNTLWSC
jgi:hypothetical protein